jgi:transposase-like protein
MSRKGKYGSDAELVTALACGATIEGAARKYGVSESTIYRRLRDPEFRQRIKDISAETLKRTVRMLTASAPEATRTLLTLLEPSNPASVRLGASRSNLDRAVRMREHVEFEERLTAIEQQTTSQAAA